jgi:hypothetical protein
MEQNEFSLRIRITPSTLSKHGAHFQPSNFLYRHISHARKTYSYTIETPRDNRTASSSDFNIIVLFFFTSWSPHAVT